MMMVVYSQVQVGFRFKYLQKTRDELYTPTLQGFENY